MCFALGVWEVGPCCHDRCNPHTEQTVPWHRKSNLFFELSRIKLEFHLHFDARSKRFSGNDKKSYLQLVS